MTSWPASAPSRKWRFGRSACGIWGASTFAWARTGAFTCWRSTPCPRWSAAPAPSRRPRARAWTTATRCRRSCRAPRAARDWSSRPARKSDARPSRCASGSPSTSSASTRNTATTPRPSTTRPRPSTPSATRWRATDIRCCCSRRPPSCRAS